MILSKNIDKNRKKHLAIIALLAAAFYLVIGFKDGPIIAADSASYISMDITREPVYPLFLLILRTIFGESIQLYGLPFYLTVAVVLQSMLWTFAAYYVGRVVYKYGVIYSYAAAFFQIAVSCINRFIANRGSMYSETILTESLAMPLYVIFCVVLWQWYEDNTARRKNHAGKEDALTYVRNRFCNRYFITLLLLIFVLISIRKQMLITVLMMLAMSFLHDILFKKFRSIKSFFITIIAMVVVVSVSNLMDCTYNYVHRGAWITHTGNNKAAFCTLMYAADESYAEYISDEGIRKLFLDMIAVCDEEGLLLKNTTDDMNWLDITNHYADSYDVIGYNIMMPMVDEYVAENYSADYPESVVISDEVQGVIIDALIKHPSIGLVQVVFYNIVKGLVYSNCRATSLGMVVISFALYLIYLVGVVSIYRYSKTNEGKGYDIILFAEITLLGILVNSVSVGATIFPQPRYMAYGMGMFFLVLFIEICKFLESKPLIRH
jgi:hypothetical protein